MKKITSFVLAVFITLFCFNFVLANNSQGPNLEVQEQRLNEKMQRIQERLEIKKEIFQEEEEELEGTEQEVARNQNQVRLAVHSLLEMKEVVGGIGPQVSEIAKEFNNSVQNTQKLELRIANRNAFTRFFMGGDKEAAKELKDQIEQNRNRIQELYKLREQCDCQEEIQNMFQEQLQEMEDEQDRLEELTKKENQSRGLFGWLFGWLW